MRKSAEEIAVATAELAVLIAKVAKVGPNGAARIAYDAGKLAHGLSVLAEVDCNSGLTPGQQKREERLREKVRELFRTSVDERITVTFGGDPRGFVVKLHFPEIDGRKPSNTWGGESEGWGIG